MDTASSQGIPAFSVVDVAARLGGPSAPLVIDDRCLADLARIVRGADTGKSELTPQSPGLTAISLGRSGNFPDDHGMRKQGMVMYDALYAWIKPVRAEMHNANLFRESTT